jgi:LysM repeat protein
MLNPKTPVPGPERFVLALALLVPLVLIGLAASQMSGMYLGLTSAASEEDSGDQLIAARPAPSNLAPPPTLAVPTATPRPTPTAVPSPTPVAAASPQTGRQYTVKPGDQLKEIAAGYHMTVWQLIDANNIPNPDSLRVGQVLRIPDG